MRDEGFVNVSVARNGILVLLNNTNDTPNGGCRFFQKKWPQTALVEIYQGKEVLIIITGHIAKSIEKT